MLWLGVSEGQELLAQLAPAVGALLEPAGYPPEPRPYHGHLTLARLRTPTDLRPVVAAVGPDPVGRAWPASEVVLVESRQGPSGSDYTPRARFPLG